MTCASRRWLSAPLLLALATCASVQSRIVDNYMRTCARGDSFSCMFIGDNYRVGASVDGDTVFEPDAIQARDRYLKTCNMAHDESWRRGLPDGVAQSCRMLLQEHFVVGAQADAVAAKLKEMGMKVPTQEQSDEFDAAWNAKAATSAKIDRQQIARDGKAGPDDFIYHWGMAPGETEEKACSAAKTRGLRLLDCMKRTDNEKSFSTCDCVKPNETFTFCKTRVGCRYL